jgi:hypothetical protein
VLGPTGFAQRVGALTLLGSGPSLCPVPMPKALSPIIVAHNALRVSILHLEHLAVSGCPDADFYGAVNFALKLSEKGY